MIATAAPEIRIGKDTFDTESLAGVKLDQLGRREQGARLSDLVDRLPGPFVIALDGAWGTGKSHFLQLWCGSHGALFGKKDRVIHFDAFAHDWREDPLIPLAAAVTSDTTAPEGKKKQVGRWALRLGRTATRVGLAAATGGLSEFAGPALDAALAKGGAEADAALDRIWAQEESRADALDAFRSALEELASSEGKLILVIDELDRCRPDFALALLEIAKHAFAVPGVVFVLGVNLEALGHSVRKRYGAGVDAEVYLQKFVNMAFRLPDSNADGAPAWQPFFTHRCATAGVPEAVYREALGLLSLVGPAKAPTLRDTSRIVSRLALLPADISNWSRGPKMIVLSSAVAEVMFPAKLHAARRSPDAVEDLLACFDRAASKKTAEQRYLLYSAWKVVTATKKEDAPIRLMSLAGHGAWLPEIFALEDLLRPTLDTFTLPYAPTG